MNIAPLDPSQYKKIKDQEASMTDEASMSSQSISFDGC